MSEALPLGDVLVADFTQFVAGSYCTQLLGDLGADVVKVELPGRGDPYRGQGPEYVGGEATLFLALNRNKRSLALDWKRPEGRAVLDRLLRRADVFVENARPGSLARYGLERHALRERYPRLVCCSISGYGQSGPSAQRGGFDLILQGEGGLMAVTGEAGGAPVKAGAPVLDVGAAQAAVSGILAALYARARTGDGALVESSLLDFSLAALGTVAQSFFATGSEPPRLGSASPSFAPYQAVAVGGEWMTIAGAGNEDLWRRLCDVLERPDLAEDARFRTNARRLENRAALIAAVEQALRDRPLAEWLRRFDAAGVPAGPINGIGRAFSDPQVRARGIVQTVAHPTAGDVPIVSAPVRLGETPLPFRRPPPRLGEHTREILRQLGLTDGEVDRLVTDGVVA